MPGQGTATVDFGAFPGTTHATVAVTGQAGITGTSLVEAWLFPAATADHSVDEHIMAAAFIDVVAADIVAGDGFTIHAVARHAGTEPLQLPGIEARQSVNATVGLNARPPQGITGSVGGADLSRQYGQFTVGWVWA